MPIDTVKVINEYMKKYNLTGKDMAKKLGVHPVTLCKWKNGKAEPSKLHLHKIKRLLIESEENLPKTFEELKKYCIDTGITIDTITSIIKELELKEGDIH